jgi:hypothetical protein
VEAVAQNEPAEHTAVAVSAANDHGDALPFLDLAAWVGREPADRHFLVPGLIPGGCVTSLYGDGGSGKTLLALDLMVCMASQYSALWLGVKTLGFKSVGLFAEDDAEEIIRRLQRICQAREIDFATVASSISALPGVGLDTIVGDLNDRGEVVATPLMVSLICHAKEIGASLLVLDYAASLFGGNEIDRAQVSAFMRFLNRLANDHDIAILLLGHPSVDGMKGGRGTSGSTAWRNQSRAFLHLTVDEEQDDPEGRRLLTLALTKANYSRAGRTFKLASDGSRFDLLEAGEGLKPKAKGPRLSASQKVALKALHQALDADSQSSPGGPIPSSVRVTRLTLWRECAYRLEISGASEEARKKAFSRAVKELIAKDLVGVNDPLCWAAPEPEARQSAELTSQPEGAQ